MIKRNPRSFVLLVRIAIEQAYLESPYTDFVPLDKFVSFAPQYFSYLLKKELIEMSDVGVRITGNWLSIIPIT